MSHILHVGHLAETLHHGVVVNLDHDLVAVDTRQLRCQGGAQVESFAFPVSREVLTALEDRASLVDQDWTTDADEGSELDLFLGGMIDQLSLRSEA
jgi:hypothetical protein